MVSKIDCVALLAQFEQYLTGTGYARPVAAHYLDCAESFLAYLSERQMSSLNAAEPSDVSSFLREELRTYRRRHRRSPLSTARWRQWRIAGVRRFLVVILGQWPPTAPAASPFEERCRAVCEEYSLELRERRNLASSTVYGHVAGAEQFLDWVGKDKKVPDLGTLTVFDIDRYIKARVGSIQRTTRKAVSFQLRSFLRFLHRTGRIGADLAACVIAPTLYRYEGIPSVLEPEQVREILISASKDRSPNGLRNYAMLMLLATYGLRSGEIRRLQLEDVDWRGERLWIRHTKTGVRSCLPLMPKVGHALLNYLRVGRPKCAAREIFIRCRAPRCGFFTSSTLNSMLRRHLAKIGIRPAGKRGPHVFRHSRAVSLLRAGVPVKEIGDVLGHRSAASTNVYLKLDDHELRSVALAIPTTEARS
jgi:site-specific recombinase XerD